MSSSTRLILALAVLCAGLAAADLFHHRHSYFPLEARTGFYAVFGLFMGVVLLIAAKAAGALLRRNENYYAPHSVEAEAHPEADLGRESADA